MPSIERRRVDVRCELRETTTMRLRCRCHHHRLRRRRRWQPTHIDMLDSFSLAFSHPEKTEIQFVNGEFHIACLFKIYLLIDVIYVCFLADDLVRPILWPWPYQQSYDDCWTRARARPLSLTHWIIQRSLYRKVFAFQLIYCVMLIIQFTTSPRRMQCLHLTSPVPLLIRLHSLSFRVDNLFGFDIFFCFVFEFPVTRYTGWQFMSPSLSFSRSRALNLRIPLAFSMGICNVNLIDCTQHYTLPTE